MDETSLIRLKMGFPGRIRFLKEHAIYTEKTLEIAGHEIMQKWETNYMKQLASIACKNGGTVLELGFGMGVSANYIQKYRYFRSKPRLKNHIIIEAHPEVCEYANKMFKKEIANGQINLIQGYWENVTKKFKKESFDGILFDTYALTKEEIHKNHFYFFKEAHRLLKNGGVLTYYSDEAKQFSEEHLQKLKEAGFKNIKGKTCKVSPPKKNMYWRKKTLLTPIIIK